jgi:triosephosphate isomerase (TIM)
MGGLRMRRLLIAGNWKMNLLNNEAVSLARQVRLKTLGLARVDVLLLPPFTALTAVAEILSDSDISLGAQNLHDRRSGAFTGEVSGEQIRSAGGGFVLVGHSERRQLFGDGDEWIARKLQAALEAGLHPVLCVGETLDERQAGRLEAVLEQQVSTALASFTAESCRSLTLAYEPVWAIGTGVTASPEQAQEAHGLLRTLCARVVDPSSAANLRILYGGSVNPENARSLLAQPDIDGALVGGASLKAEDFCRIVQTAETVHKQ